MTYLSASLSVIILILTGCSFSLHAAQVSIYIADNQGKPLTNIVALLHSTDMSKVAKTKPAIAIMDQINREFVPHTLVVQQGTKVDFPNSDNVQHHVYSFSPAKTFELKLYSELEVEPQLFNTPGVVELGCNVHDWMLGYIYVADTPYFAQSNSEGKATITVPDGDYTMSIWHPRLSESDTARMSKINVGNDDITVSFSLFSPLLPSLVEYDAVEGFTEYD
ncbi:methylamine utilization protein [Alteromonas sp. BMJM2]|uniref:methylamine utilization protein n=1 Tax=Alteromonas sp. BMJM2 TaxID=2954241 RepID=UPI0022B32E24|nr:methylamine utilization protein [Alteromonas sp. BMJM2]